MDRVDVFVTISSLVEVSSFVVSSEDSKSVPVLHCHGDSPSPEYKAHYFKQLNIMVAMSRI